MFICFEVVIFMRLWKISFFDHFPLQLDTIFYSTANCTYRVWLFQMCVLFFVLDW